MFLRLLILSFFMLLLDRYAFEAVLTSTHVLSSQMTTVIYTVYWALAGAAVLYVWLQQLGILRMLKKQVHYRIRAYVILLAVAKLCTSVFVFIDDLRRMLLWIVNAVFSDQAFEMGRSLFLANSAVIAGIIPIVLLTYGMLRNKYRYRVEHLDIPVKGLHDDLEGFSIVQISDIHAGSFDADAPIQKAIDLINRLEPDLICFTGDLVNYTASEIDPFKGLFSQLNAPYGIYSITGNHDYGDYVAWHSESEKTENFKKLMDTHAEMGWNLLMDAHKRIKIGKASINVVGVQNISAKRFARYGSLQKASSGMKQADFTVLLSHDPSHWEMEVAGERFADINLTLSGHTHGFQFGLNIPGIIRWSPVQYVYKQWSGLYQKGMQYLYVNRGFGFLGYPGRVGMLPEITALRLIPSQ